MNLLSVSHQRDVSGTEICTRRIVENIKDDPVLVVLPEGAFADGLRQAGFVVEVENGLTKIARSEDIFSWPRMVDRFPGVVQRAGLTHNMTTELVTMHFHVTGDADLVVRAIKGRS